MPPHDREASEAFNKRREPGGLDTIGVDSSQEIIEHRSVISGGAAPRTYVGLRSEIFQEPHRHQKRGSRSHPAAACAHSEARWDTAQRAVQDPFHKQATHGEDARCGEEVLAGD